MNQGVFTVPRAFLGEGWCGEGGRGHKSVPGLLWGGTWPIGIKFT